MHLSSLPSPHGIGTMGQAARDFVDFLKESGQSVWQMLPICPTGFGDSPYQSPCTFAGNPYLIDLDELCKMGFLEESDYETVDWESVPECVNYGALYEKRYLILRKAAERFLSLLSETESAGLSLANEYRWFCSENAAWLSDFALFMALKEVHGGKAWYEWLAEHRNGEVRAIAWARTECAHEIEIVQIYQFFFWKQWWELKSYANEKGIEIVGDLPIYVPLDSVDVWAHPELFLLDRDKMPREVAGVPPDGFTADGQLWGNPLYDWEYMEQAGFDWWVNRIAYLCRVYDVLRIDHFRAFESYYVVQSGEQTAKNGVWRKGPGMKLFRAVEEKLGRPNIIAEDLGYLTEEVHQLLRDSGFPGMKVLEFAFDSRDSSGNVYLPHNYVRNCVAYAGTHDNNTILGWFASLSAEDAAYVRAYLRLSDKPSDWYWEMICALWGSVADLVIVQMQDLLGLSGEARMNTPSTLGKNWRWRIGTEQLTHELADKLRDMTILYGR